MIRLETKTIFHCKCNRCGYEWNAESKPKRCASCKYRTWNGEDQRFNDPFDPKGSAWASSPVPLSSRIKAGAAPPKLQYNAIVEALDSAQLILAEVVEDNPGDEQSKQALDKITRQLARLRPLSGSKNGKRKTDAAAVAKGA